MNWAPVKKHGMTAFIALVVVVVVLLVVTTNEDGKGRRLKANLYNDGEKPKTV